MHLSVCLQICVNTMIFFVTVQAYNKGQFVFNYTYYTVHMFVSYKTFENEQPQIQYMS